MKTHWTARSNKAFLYRVVSDFIGQLEKKLEKENLSREKLAKKLNISKGRVSQVLNNPGNVSLLTVIKFARILGMKVSVIAYEDDDPKNVKGPINPEVFEGCWTKCDKPHDFWQYEGKGPTTVIITRPDPFIWGGNLDYQLIDESPDPAKLTPEFYKNLDRIKDA